MDSPKHSGSPPNELIKFYDVFAVQVVGEKSDLTPYSFGRGRSPINRAFHFSSCFVDGNLSAKLLTSIKLTILVLKRVFISGESIQEERYKEKR